MHSMFNKIPFYWLMQTTYLLTNRKSRDAVACEKGNFILLNFFRNLVKTIMEESFSVICPIGYLNQNLSLFKQRLILILNYLLNMLILLPMTIVSIENMLPLTVKSLKLWKNGKRNILVNLF